MRILRLLVWGVLAVGVLCVPCMAQDAETPAAEPPPAADPAEAAAAEVRDEAAAATALPGWLAAVRVRKPEGNLEFPVRWFPDDGVSLLVRSRDTRATWTLLTLDREGLAVRLGDSANAEGRELTAVRIWDADVAREPHGEIAVTLKFREHEWIVYLGGQLFASVAAPFSPPAEVFVAETQAQLLRGAMRFRPVPQEMYRSDFMIEEGAPDQLYPWKIQSGSWRIHTAQEDALERPESDLSRVKQVPLTADKSPNFYSLKGGGKDALLTTGYDFYDDYVYAAALQLNEGEAGLAFYHRGDGSYYAYTLCIQSPPA